MRAAAKPGVVLQYDPVQLLGTVIRMEAGGYCVVQCEATEWRVQRAASCLLVPAVGDTVLISGPIPKQTYLIAVIHQSEPSTARLETQGHMVIACPRGNISVQAGHSVTLQGDEDVVLDTAVLHMRVNKAECTVGELDYMGTGARVSVSAVRLIGSACEVVMDRISQLAHQVFRLTEDTEQVRAGRIDYQAEHTVRLHAQHTLLTGTDLVKVDADQIHMG
ncbi:DUF3540 domain-containing protein [Pollutimonas harenae]|uniref:DUF3540 domain-containing protein n=1 Tax=Pollutimonas harenae TaxID=657015 RepID=A0A853GTJ8_9BURK|nr:DUF3540 domain-containing protein [Pollutimonas harenae]NYT86488.1 DUF3540 domain-containing protein [Pollutimonas harenae]TEA69767.1 DUF3540 domain-containing protein [Pollutimonas harenae]